MFGSARSHQEALYNINKSNPRSMHCFILRVRSSHFMFHRIYPCTRRLICLSMYVPYACIVNFVLYHASGVASPCDHLKHVIVSLYTTARCTCNLF